MLWRRPTPKLGCGAKERRKKKKKKIMMMMKKDRNHHRAKIRTTYDPEIPSSAKIPRTLVFRLR
jgi:hypothetical protein